MNTPPNDLTPELFADGVLALAKEQPGRAKPKVEIEVLGADELAELGCGGILGVGLGSANPPRLVKLTWSSRGRSRAAWPSSARASPTTPAG